MAARVGVHGDGQNEGVRCVDDDRLAGETPSAYVLVACVSRRGRATFKAAGWVGVRGSAERATRIENIRKMTIGLEKLVAGGHAQSQK